MTWRVRVAVSSRRALSRIPQPPRLPSARRAGSRFAGKRRAWIAARRASELPRRRAVCRSRSNWITDGSAARNCSRQVEHIAATRANHRGFAYLQHVTSGRRTQKPGAKSRAGADKNAGGYEPPSSRRNLVENEIQQHAKRLFSERGFAGTSLQDIADAMGMTRPALYYYVKSKDELLAKLVHEITFGTADNVADAAKGAGRSSGDRLRDAARRLLVARAEAPEQFRLLDRSEAELPPDIAEAHLRAKRRVVEELSQLIEEGVLTGQFRPVEPRVAALAVLGMCNWVSWWFRPGPGHPVAPVADQIADMAVASLMRPAGPGVDGLVSGPRGVITALRNDLDLLDRLLAEVGRSDPSGGAYGGHADEDIGPGATPGVHREGEQHQK